MNRLLLATSIFLFIVIRTIYASWYEEPEVIETENIDSMWWLSRKKKEVLKREQKIEISKIIEKNKDKDFKDKKIKWLYDDTNILNFPKDKWEVIDDDNDGIGYNYYFDKDGFLLIDTLTKDYRVVDKRGREVDYDFRPIKYYVATLGNGDIDVTNEEESYALPTREPSKVLIGEGVTFRKKEKIYDNSVNKNVLDYIDKSNRFIESTKGTIYNEVVWKKCSSLKGKGGYVIFNNPKNNFNKMTGYISTQYDIFSNEKTACVLKVYDADMYDKYKIEHRLYDIEEIYINDSFNNTDAIKFSFTFDRSIKRLMFVIDTEADSKNRTCYLRDLKYGFNKKAFYDELIRKKEDEEEIEELKRLGIYVEDLWSFEALDENGEVIDEDNDEEDDKNNDDYLGGKSYIFEEETRNYEDVVRDRNTGPAFDESLQNIKEIGPGIINVE